MPDAPAPEPAALTPAVAAAAVSAADIEACGWLAIAQPHHSYRHLTTAFSAAAAAARDAGNAAHAGALQLLADACSMTLDADNPARPFRPAWQAQDGAHSPVPAVFDDATVNMLFELVPRIGHDLVRARLAEIVWCRARRRGPAPADLAIAAYTAAPPDAKRWQQGQRGEWSRAAWLAQSLGRKDEAARIGAALEGAFWAVAAPELGAAVEFAAVIFKCRLVPESQRKIAERLAELGMQELEANRFTQARELLASAAEWLGRTKDGARRAEVTAALARSWQLQAQAAKDSTSPSFIAAGDALEKALQIYRTIPRKERARLGIEAMVDALQLEQHDAGLHALGEMGSYSTGPHDITGFVTASMNQVAGKNEVDMLRELASLTGGPNVEFMRAEAIKVLQENVIGQLFSRVTISRDGRVIDKVGGLDGNENGERRLTIQMMQHFGINMGLTVQGQILPALEVAAAEHPLFEEAFIILARESRIVPPDRVRQVGRGLYFGYIRDFETALHYLVPQVENLVRYHLKHAGAVTINTDENGIQMELGLSSLVKLPQMEQVFGPNLTFEITALFCEQNGPNLRNDMAHGLLPDGAAAASLESVYAWGLVFRLVFRSSRFAKAQPAGQEHP